ncbi:MAG TPA: hypothetical protein VJ937_00500, partial [Salinivirga sp.]|uniref:hypothetical protein n=1 Tax=Salinivirga sp. TaxID=1970192 RepID=UPI002B46D0AE
QLASLGLSPFRQKERPCFGALKKICIFQLFLLLRAGCTAAHAGHTHRQKLRFDGKSCTFVKQSFGSVKFERSL